MYALKYVSFNNNCQENWPGICCTFSPLVYPKTSKINIFLQEVHGYGPLHRCTWFVT